MKLSAIASTVTAIVSVAIAHPTTPATYDEQSWGHCVPLPAGKAPSPGAPTMKAFLTYGPYSTYAVNAARIGNVPKGYLTSFYDAPATVLNPDAYLDRIELEHYNTTACAEACNAVVIPKGNGKGKGKGKAKGKGKGKGKGKAKDDKCRGFNTYVERSPSKIPGPACPNPDPTYRFVCVLYKEPVVLRQAKNEGGLMESFEIGVRGSNGYLKWHY